MTVPIPHEQGYTFNDAQVENRGVVVTSTYPISLYASNYRDASYDATIILPITGLGDKYVAQMYEGTDLYSREIVVVATHDGTTVNIIPHVNNAAAFFSKFFFIIISILPRKFLHTPHSG